MINKHTNESVINMSSTKTKKAEIISIASGKGGVGKTLFSINLAIEASLAGKKVLVLDGDLGLANIHIMAGIYPDFDLMDVVNNKKTIKEIVVEGPCGIHIIPGASGIFQLSNLSHVKRQQLIDQLNEIESLYDLIIIDIEAGINYNVLKFVSISDRTIIVTTPDLTALSDAYATIKVIRTKKSTENIGVVVNRARSTNEADMVFKKLQIATDKFLNFKISNYGMIMEDSITVKESIQQRKPIVIHFPKSKFGVSIKTVACVVFNLEAKKIIEPGVLLNRFSMLLENMRTKESV